MKFNQNYIGAGHEIATFAMSEERFWQEVYLATISEGGAVRASTEADHALHQYRERKGIEE